MRSLSVPAALAFAFASIGAPARAGPEEASGKAVQAPRPDPVPVTAAAIVALARDLGWPAEADPQRNAVRIPIAGENVDFDLFVQPAGTDARGVQLVTFAVPQVVLLPPSHALLDEVLQRLMTLNWDRVVGHWSWDRRDGEIRFEYVHLTAGPLEMAELVAIVERVATTIDDDFRKIHKAMGVEAPPPVTAGVEIERGHGGATGPRTRLPKAVPPPGAPGDEEP